MTAPAWWSGVLDPRVRDGALVAAARSRLSAVIDPRTERSAVEDSPDYGSALLAAELTALDALASGESEAARVPCARVFQLLRAEPLPDSPADRADALLRRSCFGLLGDRGVDVARDLRSEPPSPPADSSDWGERVRAAVFHVWLLLFRKEGWKDLDAVQAGVVRLRSEQARFEADYLSRQASAGVRPAWELVFLYHLAKAAEILATFLTQGASDRRFDVGVQLEAQFDRAVAAAARGGLKSDETLARILAPAARQMAENSVWTVTRAVNSRVTKFAAALVAGSTGRAMFEMLPPQRRALREQGLLGSGDRSVVVSLPTSSGKTLIAQFRILQALNQFDADAGWVAYVAPTRALVNQVAARLRRDFAPMGIVVEKVSPALDVDGVEGALLTEGDAHRRFRVLVTTPEKLDLMLRGGWETRIGRPLTLVVVDEAHGIGAAVRGLRLELLLATINRECRNAQFLLLTPFVPNAADVAKWLDDRSHREIGLSVDWKPNDRVIGIVRARRAATRGGFSVEYRTRHTNRDTLTVPETLAFSTGRPLGLSWSGVSKNKGMIAAATAAHLAPRSPVVVIAGTVAATWKIALRIAKGFPPLAPVDEDMAAIRTYLEEEMGADFPLLRLLDHGVAVHHAGLSDDARALVEWLFEHDRLRALVATTTIAAGVNFPVGSVVLAAHTFPFGVPMSPADFWNIAGRTGRVDQGDLGVVALVAKDDEEEAKLGDFIDRSVESLNSTLIGMVLKARDTGQLARLETLAHEPEWSAFLQYIAHSYRLLGDHAQFVSTIEHVLRGTLGYRDLRANHRELADRLLAGVLAYADRFRRRPDTLKLVDATGFSFESVTNSLRRLSDARVDASIWRPDLFTAGRENVRRLMGLLFEVPELRPALKAVTGGPSPDGKRLAAIVCDWVGGSSLPEMARRHFGAESEAAVEDSESDDDALTRCCRVVFGKLTHVASWGLSALQAMTLRDSLESAAPDDARAIRNLPARVYYGVNTDAAISLRLLGVPRSLAVPLATALGISPADPLDEVRAKLRRATSESLSAAAFSRPRSKALLHAWRLLVDETGFPFDSTTESR